MLCLSVPLLAQRTITNKDFRGRITEQYQINANGDYHGTYTKYFDNGVIQESAMYNKGNIVSCKTYEYHGKRRYLMSDKTWDKKGEILTSKIRPYNYSNGEVGEVIETAGLLRNGRWRGWPGHETYIEIYNGNDTIYEWQDRSKSKFRGKFFNGERVKTTKEIHLLNEIATRDSILCIDNYACKLAAVHMYKAKDIDYYINQYNSSLLITHAYKIQNVDSVLLLKSMHINAVIDTVYREALNMYCTLDVDSIYMANKNNVIQDFSDLYTEVLMLNFGHETEVGYSIYNTDEVPFYAFLCNYVKTGTDETLRALIIDALNLQGFLDIRNLDIHICTDYHGKPYAEIRISEGNLSRDCLKSCNSIFNKEHESNYTILPYTQAKLLKVIMYCEANGITIK